MFVGRRQLYMSRLVCCVLCNDCVPHRSSVYMLSSHSRPIMHQPAYVAAIRQSGAVCHGELSHESCVLAASAVVACSSYRWHQDSMCL